jgi:hypothetical protein
MFNQELKPLTEGAQREVYFTVKQKNECGGYRGPFLFNVQPGDETSNIRGSEGSGFH